jgi:transposase
MALDRNRSPRCAVVPNDGRTEGRTAMYLGIDTHKHAHVLVALDEQGRVVGTRSLANTAEGWVGALGWARQQAAERHWGIENSGSWGKGLAQFLLTQGEGDVREVRPQRTAQYRRRGRSQDKTIRPTHWPLPMSCWPRARSCRRCRWMT